jgi:hypothetical protein
MNGPARLAAAAILLIAPSFTAEAQMHYEPTPAPLVTAEREPWYLAGEPVMHSGNVYYPAGPQIHFLPHEMVRSGFYHGIPLYTRTTIEPMSILFVPIARGLMQPYERRRDGELAGTVGSHAPAFPVTRFGEHPTDAKRLRQAPAPPYRAPVYLPDATGRAQPPSEPIGMFGKAATPGRLSPPVKRQESANGLFVEFQGARWFSTGAAIEVDVADLTRHGAYHGFPVYTRTGDAAVYIPISGDRDAPLARYVRR